MGEEKGDKASRTGGGLTGLINGNAQAYRPEGGGGLTGCSGQGSWVFLVVGRMD